MEESKIVEIKRIEVEGLFGSFDYTIETNNLNSENKLILLYGDNGSGKTTILKLVFYLLSTQDNSGHKSEISKIKFKKFSVVLSNKIRISAVREKIGFGTYNYVVNEENKSEPIFSVILQSRSENDLSIVQDINTKKDHQFHMILDYVSKLNIKLFYLSDSRKSLNTNLIDNYQNEIERAYDLTYDEIDLKILRHKLNRQEEPDLINSSIKSLENFFKSEVLKASNIGEQESSNIYLRIVEQITSTNSEDKDSLITKIKDLTGILEDVKKRSESFSKFGLVSTTEYSQIIIALSVAGGKQEIIFNILEPFIRGLKAKLDALENIQRQLSSFTGCLNSFLSYKVLSYSIINGFNIIQNHTNERLNFKDLSSGEKQLVLLFSSAILASSRATVFIIDEPEISLNIKWQRKLLDYLLHLTPNNNIQYIIATHSIELITNQKNSVIRLENQKKY